MAQTKLTMVSIGFKGRRYTMFIQIKPDGDGRVRVDEKDLPWPTTPENRRGMTYTPGG